VRCLTTQTATRYLWAIRRERCAKRDFDRVNRQNRERRGRREEEAEGLGLSRGKLAKLRADLLAYTGTNDTLQKVRSHLEREPDWQMWPGAERQLGVLLLQSPSPTVSPIQAFVLKHWCRSYAGPKPFVLELRRRLEAGEDLTPRQLARLAECRAETEQKR
jgi:hypothetical protein